MQQIINRKYTKKLKTRIDESMYSLKRASSLLSSSCKKWSEACRVNVDCCPRMGHRIVCAPSLEIWGKKMCCITEVEEQQEKQAAIIRNRRPKSK
ncbi:unnamed protein product [Rotaria sordida]|uniref:Uncharacterized protein n=1 Tax=Rotaria sordida TaxID=392033 RepID=A0A818QVQ6_9BILA|nr:unnamed protein product [Rotaria sordida]